MASKWSEVERVDSNSLPTMLAQAIIVGATLTVGAIACSGLYLSMIGKVVALLPWMTIFILLAVAFTYVIGFALLWCAEAITLHMKEQLKPFAYGAVGLITYGLWGLLVGVTLMNSVDQPVNNAVLSNMDVIAVVLSFVAFGFVAFLLAKMYAPKLATLKTQALALLIVQIVLAIIGIIVMIMLFSAIYR